jgi:hypothetical protein
VLVSLNRGAMPGESKVLPALKAHPVTRSPLA